MKKKCIICNGTPRNRFSNLCEVHFNSIFAKKLKEEDQIEKKPVKIL